jgi:hypothetical protein
MTAATAEFDVEMDAIEAPSKGRKRVPSLTPTRTIIIDEVEGGENFEVVGVNGKVYQIQRGVEVKVPQEVVEVLRTAVATRFVKVKREDGESDLVPRQHSAIPWRLVD